MFGFYADSYKYKPKIFEKNEIFLRGIHYFITKFKTKIPSTKVWPNSFIHFWGHHLVRLRDTKATSLL